MKENEEQELDVPDPLSSSIQAMVDLPPLLEKKPVNTRLFVGFLLTKELKTQLNHHKMWQQARILQQSLEDGLTETHFENKEYIGYYLVGDKTSVRELKERESLLQKLLQPHCPHIDFETLRLHVFPQVFLS